MERESLLAVLMILLGGMALQLISAGLSTHSRSKRFFEPERVAWFRLLRPLIPALLVAACLCGWALSQPDPVPDRVGPLVFIVCAPFGLIGVRAILRAAWSLLRGPNRLGIATIGLIRPHIVIAPALARFLDDRAMRAALAHERAHVRHLDPLRIWIAQFVTDLQWPWTSAQKRFERWLAALERARDDEARAEGIEGADLAAALVASVRFHRNMTSGGGAGVCARLTGDRSALEERVARLLQPLAGEPKDRTPTILQVAFLLSLALVVAVALGVVYGERFVGTLLALS
jgi:Zn-dependent protease with chaperone function